MTIRPLNLIRTYKEGDVLSASDINALVEAARSFSETPPQVISHTRDSFRDYPITFTHFITEVVPAGAPLEIYDWWMGPNGVDVGYYVRKPTSAYAHRWLVNTSRDLPASDGTHGVKGKGTFCIDEGWVLMDDSLDSFGLQSIFDSCVSVGLGGANAQVELAVKPSNWGLFIAGGGQGGFVPIGAYRQIPSIDGSATRTLMRCRQEHNLRAYGTFLIGTSGSVTAGDVIPIATDNADPDTSRKIRRNLIIASGSPNELQVKLRGCYAFTATVIATTPSDNDVLRLAVYRKSAATSKLVTQVNLKLVNHNQAVQITLTGVADFEVDDKIRLKNESSVNIILNGGSEGPSYFTIWRVGPFMAYPNP